jgi:hypothetical protein
MKGMLGVVITLVLALVIGGLYWFLLKPKVFDTKIQDLQGQIDANKDHLDKIQTYQAAIPDMKAQLPRWQRQFDIFRQAIPVELEDDVFLRNLNQQLEANNVQLLRVSVTPSGQWMRNLNDTQKANYIKENMNPDEIAKVKVAEFDVSLSGSYADVLRAFENLKLYGRIYSIDQIVSPSGGAGGAVFQNVSQQTTPIEVRGKVFYGLSENYLSQGTLNTYFGKADVMDAAGELSGVDMDRADQVAANPASVPTAPATPPPGKGKTAAPGAGKPGETGAAGGEAAGEPKPGGTGGAAAPAGAAAPGGSANSGTAAGARVAQTTKSHSRTVAVGG